MDASLDKYVSACFAFRHESIPPETCQYDSFYILEHSSTWFPILVEFFGNCKQKL